MEGEIFDSKLLGIIILSIVGLLILVFIFGLGVFVGEKRADFSFRWAEAYHSNFGGPAGGFLGDPTGKEFSDANGSFGQIIKIDGNTLTVKDNDENNTEKTILVTNNTTIKFQRKTEKVSDLKVGDSIVVIGNPNSSGQINAELIRVMPAGQSLPTLAPMMPGTNPQQTQAAPTNLN